MHHHHKMHKTLLPPPLPPHNHPLLTTQAVDCNICEGKSAGFLQVPETSCSEFVQCNNGQVAQSFSCQPGLIYDKNINQCNWEASATCGEDYVCPTPPPTVSPSGSPTEMPTSYAPTTSPERAGGFKPSLPSGSSSGGFQTSLSYTSTSTNGNELTPIKEPHHAVVWAHLFANKISISNQLLSMAHSMHKVSGSNVESDELRNYAFLDFSNALRSMVEEGYAVPMTDAEGNEQLGRNRFYFGDAESVNGAAIGLINVAAFLSQALAESISNGSCDELNTDSVNGFLPISNACGQHGLSYQDMHCSGEESEMECPLDVYMETRANDNGRVTPFYCGPVDRYDGFTGVADVTRSGEVKQDFPVQNRDGRTDVQGCCWWGRGTINTRGVCQYGKLNYYLGARAASEGRPSRYPNIDFCATPQMICSTDHQDREIEWVTGLFRWIDTVQSYNSPSWNYLEQLHQFVLGGMTDGFFLHSVSGIVSQGCHDPPCEGYANTGAEMADVGERWAYFQQVAGALGLPVKSSEQSR
eukprot:g12259.t1 g12259   contig6:1573630-1575326(+)